MIWFQLSTTCTCSHQHHLNSAHELIPDILTSLPSCKIESNFNAIHNHQRHHLNYLQLTRELECSKRPTHIDTSKLDGLTFFFFAAHCSLLMTRKLLCCICHGEKKSVAQKKSFLLGQRTPSVIKCQVIARVLSTT